MSIKTYIILLMLILPTVIFSQSVVEIQGGAAISVDQNADICSDQYVVNGVFNVSGTMCSLLPAPLLVSPADGSTVGPPVTCVWNKRTSAINYRFQLSSDSLFGTIVLNDSTLTDSLKMVSGLSLNTNYWWRVRAKNSTGWGPWSIKRRFKTTLTGTGNNLSELPKEFKLYDNYPNPFNPATTIKYDIPNNTFVKLAIYDITGKQLEVLVNKNVQAGSYEVTWNGLNYSSGAYFARIEAGSYDHIIKMMLIK